MRLHLASLALLLACATCASAAPRPFNALGMGRRLQATSLTCANLTTCVTATQTCTPGSPTKTVTVSLGCKSGDTWSWMCCRDAGCDLVANSCKASNAGATEDLVNDNCEELRAATYTLATAATSLTLQIHDGQLTGSIACGGGAKGKDKLCCGGDEACTHTITLTACRDPPVSTAECTTSANCAGRTDLNTACGVAACNTTSGKCYSNPVPKAGTTCRASAGACDEPETCDGLSPTCPEDAFTPATTECRASAGVCDVAENCPGDAAACPTDVFKPATTECRASAGVCDVAENCPGDAAACPTDVFKPATTECRASAGVCDVAENCPGDAAACPTDVFKPATTECRASAGVCDVAENCPGNVAACPTDVFKPATTECRASAGVCDEAENCPGNAATCPEDAFKPATHTCRAAVNACDKAELCTGSSVSCPDDKVLRDRAKGFKCGKTCFFCGIPEELTFEQKKNDLTKPTKTTTGLGSCNMGACEDFIFLPASSPYCTGCVQTTCPPNLAGKRQGLSNIEHAQCISSDATNWRWNCVNKQEGTFTGEVCPQRSWYA